MIMFVRRNDSPDREDFKGPLSGLAKSSYWSRDGISMFFTESEVSSTFNQESADLFERPVPGMIGRSMRDDKTYVVAVDGEVYQIESPWPTLQAHATAVSKLAELEKRHESMIKEFLTEEAAIGLINFLIRKFGLFDTGGNRASILFEEFKAKQDA